MVKNGKNFSKNTLLQDEDSRRRCRWMKISRYCEENQFWIAIKKNTCPSQFGSFDTCSQSHVVKQKFFSNQRSFASKKLLIVAFMQGVKMLVWGRNWLLASRFKKIIFKAWSYSKKDVLYTTTCTRKKSWVLFLVFDAQLGKNTYTRGSFSRI